MPCLLVVPVLVRSESRDSESLVDRGSSQMSRVTRASGTLLCLSPDAREVAMTDRWLAADVSSVVRLVLGVTGLERA